MKLKITNKIGPMLKSKHVFENEKSIVIGRDTNQCQVVYPVEFTTVGRKHLVIEEDAGRYELRVNTKNPVYLDGILAEDDMELPDVCTIALGVKDGPSFRVERIANEELPKTKDYGKQEEIHTNLKRNKTWLKIALPIVLLVAIGLGYKALLNQNRIESISQNTEKLFKNVYKTIDTNIGQIANSLTSSVYLVLVKSSVGENPVGTAWVAQDGVLATNAHVAEVFNEISGLLGVKLIVRATYPPYKEFVINKIAIHPAYHAWEKAWKETSPRLLTVSGKPELADFLGAYDVALLYVKSSKGLAKPLKIAALDSLVKLSSGQEVAYVGFPTEQVTNQVFAEPTPTIQIANITSITDFFRSHSSFSELQLIQNSLPAAGGASGSPVINDKGEVIALLSSVNMVADGNGNRTPNAVAINYAQRADLLQLLLKKGADFPIDFITSKWDEGFAQYSLKEKLSSDALEHDRKTVVEYWKFKHNISQAKEFMHREVTIDVEDKFSGLPTTLVSFSAPKTGNYLILVIDEEKNNIDIVVADIANDKIYGSDTEPNHYPFYDFSIKQGDDVDTLIIFKDMESLNIDSTKVQFYVYHD